MTNPKILTEHYEVPPKKSLGQNFLHDPNALEKIVNLADLMPDDTVLEIGPGTGALTEVLARRVRHVISVEIDERLQPLLEDRLGIFDNVYVVYADILQTDVLKLVGPKPFVVVANLPYYITSKILAHLLENYRRPRRLVLTVQQEVAERLIAKPDDMSLLSVSVQVFGKARIAMKLNPAVFWPRPDVDSAVVVIDTYDKPPVDVPSMEAFFKVVKAGFSQKRKQLKNSVGSALGMSHEEAGALLEQAGIDPRRRAETLTLEEWAALTRIIG
ncbi:MAG: 16S rRNA (adenine(1518)-N(6)/adenine(1519)-N(6))-dimethyltransferase RsmA [Anaerolineae bacterium]